MLGCKIPVYELIVNDNNHKVNHCFTSGFIVTFKKKLVMLSFKAIIMTRRRKKKKFFEKNDIYMK